MPCLRYAKSDRQSKENTAPIGSRPMKSPDPNPDRHVEREHAPGSAKSVSTGLTKCVLLVRIMSLQTSQTSAWPCRSHVSTFVRSLHLLDLDQLDDWPEVTIQSFSAKASLQHRIRCVEWSLYHLFELYNARVTKDVGPGHAYHMLSTECE